MMLFLLLLAPQEKATLEDVIQLLESKSAKVRDLTFDVEASGAEGRMFPGLKGTVTYVRGSGLRIRAEAPDGEGLEVVYGPDAIRVIQSREDHPQRGTHRIGLSAPYGDASLKGYDLYFLPHGFPVRFYLDDPLVYYAIDPRLFLKADGEWTVEGRRMEGGRPCHLLSLKITAPAVEAKGEMVIRLHRKELLVDAESGRVVRLSMELGVSRDQNVRLEFAPLGWKPVEGLELPSKVQVTSISERRGRREKRDESLVHGFASFRANQGLAADRIATPAELADLYADLVLRSDDEYAKRIAADSKDARAHYSRGVMKAGLLSGFGGGGRLDVAGAKAAFEKAAELAPGAESPVLNLLGIARTSGDGDLEAALLAKIEKGELKGRRLVALTAGRLNTRGAHDRVLAMLDAFGGSDEERAVALMGKGELDRAAEALASAAKTTAPATVAERVAVRRGQCPEGSLNASPIEKLDALCAARDGVVFKALAVVLHRADKDPAELVGALTFYVGVGGVDALDRVETLAESPTALPAEPAGKLAAALGKLEGSRAATLAARVTIRSGGDADALLQKALDRCRGKDVDAARCAFTLALLKEDESWLAACVEAVLASAADARALPSSALRREERNPFVKLAKAHLGAKRWLDFYRLARAGEEYLGSEGPLREMAQGVAAEASKEIAIEVLKGGVVEAKAYAKIATRYFKGLGSPEVLAKALEKAPKDAELLTLLVLADREGELEDRFIADLERLIAGLEGGASADLSMSRDAALLELADVLTRRHDKEKAKAALARIDLKQADGETASAAGEAYAVIGEADLAITALIRAHELGAPTALRVGLLLEAKKEHYEALRWYNRATGSAGNQWVEPPRTGVEARERLLKRLGTDWIVETFLEQKFEALSKEQEDAAREAIDAATGDDLEDREEGLATLRKIGPKAAALMKDRVKGSEELRKVVMEWAEPR